MEVEPPVAAVAEEAAVAPVAPLPAPVAPLPAARAQADVIADLQPEGAQAIPEAGVEELETRARKMRGPEEPSQEEVERHNLTHLPAMPWCETCQKCKGNDAAHYARDRKDAVTPVIMFDYAEAGVKDDLENFEFVVGSDTSTGAIWASSVLVKGRDDAYVIGSAVSWLGELGHSRVALRAGGAPAEQALVEAIKKKALALGVCETIFVQQSERYSSQSLGGAERTVQTIRKQIKTYKYDIEKNIQKVIPHTADLMHWLPRHSAWVYNRFHVRSDTRLTPYEKVNMLKYQKPLVQIGEAVLCRRPGAVLNKLEMQWLEGVWLGKDAKTDEHFVGTAQGLCRARAIKRKIPSRRWDAALIDKMVWTPWKPSPVTKGRPPVARTDQEPVLLGPLPRVAALPDPVPAAAPTASPPPSAPAAASASVPVAVPAAVPVAVPAAVPVAVPAAATTASPPPSAPAVSQATPMAGAAPPSSPSKRERDDAVVQAARPNPAAAAASVPPPVPPLPGAPQSVVTRTAGELSTTDDQAVQRRRIAAILAVCEAPALQDDEYEVERGDEPDFTEARHLHLEKIAGDGKQIVQVVPRSQATTEPLSGRWVDSRGDDGTLKSRWTGRGFEQRLTGFENHSSGTPATMHLKAMLVNAAYHGHVAALGDCSGAFYQSPLTEEEVYLEAPPEAELPPGYVWKALCAFPGLKGAPKAWEDHSAKVLEEMGMTRSKYDGCIFMRVPTENKAGRHIDDFLVTGPKPQVEVLLGELKERLNLGDMVRLYEDGDEGTLLSMNVRKIPNGYAVQPKDSLVTDVLVELGLQDAKPSLLPASKEEKAQVGDEKKLFPSAATQYRTCVGKLIHYMHLRPDGQHTIGTLCQAMSAPTQRDLRRLKKFARFLAGTRDVYLELIPDKEADPVQGVVDADWADQRADRRSTSGGAVLYWGCAILTWARRQAVYAQSSAESELYALGTGAVEVLGFSQLLREWGEPAVPVMCSDSSSALAVVRKRGPGRMKHVELRCLAIQQWREEKKLVLRKVVTTENASDLLTKPMTYEQLVKFGHMLCLRGGIYGKSSFA